MDLHFGLAQICPVTALHFQFMVLKVSIRHHGNHQVSKKLFYCFFLSCIQSLNEVSLHWGSTVAPPVATLSSSEWLVWACSQHHGKTLRSTPSWRQSDGCL